MFFLHRLLPQLTFRWLTTCLWPSVVWFTRSPSHQPLQWESMWWASSLSSSFTFWYWGSDCGPPGNPGGRRTVKMWCWRGGILASWWECSLWQVSAYAGHEQYCVKDCCLVCWNCIKRMLAQVQFKIMMCIITRIKKYAKIVLEQTCALYFWRQKNEENMTLFQFFA